MKPIEQYGYDSVGPGWRLLLELLDEHIETAIANAVANATVATLAHRREGNSSDARVEILQVKEKMGGLRVYFHTHGMEDALTEKLRGAVYFAESMSFHTCEQCGVVGKIVARAEPSMWVRTRCGECAGEGG